MTWTSDCGTVRLYCGDCLDVLPTLEAGSVDAVVTDPPYGIGFKYATHDDTPDGYGSFLWSRIEAAERLLVSGSPVFVWQAMINIRQFCQWFPRQWRIFAAAKNFVQMRPVAMQYAFDPVVCWWTEGKAYAAGTSSRDWHIGNTANTLNRGAGEAKGHPCPRPLDQMEHVIEQWARPSGTVLDPFMGSGTTGVAAVRLGRKFIGIELDPRYFELAKRRIEGELKRFPLFERAEGPRQGELFQ